MSISSSQVTGRFGSLEGVPKLDNQYGMASEPSAAGGVRKRSEFFEKRPGFGLKNWP